MCRELGYAHPDHLLNDLTSSQITEWIAFNEIDPIGDIKIDYRFSYLYSLLTNLMIRAVGKKNARLTSVKDFKLVWDVNAPKSVQVQSIEEMKAVMGAFARTQNRNENKKKRRTTK